MANLIFSPAKINLGLRLIGRNSNGYHLLESVFLPLSFGDEITTEEAESNLVKVEWAENAPFKSSLPSQDENIVTKLLSQMDSCWKVTIRKNIPMGAGLGGGSSNAGSLLKYFVTRGVLSKEKAQAIAVKLGADVSFFLNPTPSWVTGIGENCSPLKVEGKFWEQYSVLLALGVEHCETKKVFSLYRESGMPFSESTAAPTDKSQMNHFLQSTKNDLETVVKAHYPSVRETLKILRSDTSLFSSLSGSGSACYALYQSNPNCEKNIKDLTQSLRKIGCRTVIAQIMHDGQQR